MVWFWWILSNDKILRQDFNSSTPKQDLNRDKILEIIFDGTLMKKL
jgi:hypothetical protein